jgi:hypothetical protein
LANGRVLRSQVSEREEETGEWRLTAMP